MLGPSRVGKTSLIASIFEGAKDELLVGTPFNIKPKNLATEKKLANLSKVLKSSIDAGSFNSGAVPGTQEPSQFTFDLFLVGKHKIDILEFVLLDFPGGWIDPVDRPEQREKEWKDCLDFIHDSAVLIIPIESPVLMEPSTESQRRSIVYNTHSEQIKEVVAEWAKFRNSHYPSEPSTIIFAPVKCESYFTDNGFTSNKDSSVLLYQKVQKHYEDVMNTANKEFKENLQALKMTYIPVDTIGCVEIVDGVWSKEDGGDWLRFSANYAIRKDAQIRRKGGEDIFITLMANLLEAQNNRQAAELLQAKDELKGAEEAKEQAKKDEYWWDSVLGKIGYETERTKRTKHLDQKSGQKQDVVKQKEESLSLLKKELISKLGGMSCSSRTKSC